MSSKYDVVIHDGTIVDGTGSEPYRADVAIVGDRIATLGRVTERGERDIDAEGCVVTPGFIEGHTHMDAQIMWDPLGTSSCWHGITTAVMGNCGFTVAPSREEERDLVLANLERAEDIPRHALLAGINWQWETFPEYLDVVDRLPKGINFLANIGHSALRTWAMGERAFEEASTDEDLELMRRQLQDSMRAGAVGFTTSLSAAHRLPDGRPVASRVAEWSEVEMLVATMAAEGSGMFELALGINADVPQVRASLAKLRELAMRTGAPIMLPLEPFRPRLEEVSSWLDEATQSGIVLFGQTHGRGFLSVMSFKTALPFDGLPEWAKIRSLPLDEQRRLLSDTAIRERLVAEVETADDNTYSSVGAAPRRPNFDLMCVLDDPLPPYQSIASLAHERGMHPVEVIIDLGVKSDFNQFFVQPFIPYSDEDVLTTLKHQRSVLGLSDSGAHVSQLMDSSIPTHLLAYWVREREVFTLEEAVRMLTAVPAAAWGIPDRGFVKEGLIADLNVIDPVAVRPALPEVAADLPAGLSRLTQGAHGFRATFVAGEVVHENGVHSGQLPGRLIRGPFAAPQLN